MNQQRPRATDRPTVAEDEPSGLAITAETEPPSSPAAGRAAWSNRIIGHGEAEPDRLLANPANWRVHPGRPVTAYPKATPRSCRRRLTSLAPCISKSDA